MERSRAHFAQQAALAPFKDPREAERQLHERQIYEATRQPVQQPPSPASRMATGTSRAPMHHEQMQAAEQRGEVDLDWAGNVLRRRHRRQLEPESARDNMATVMTTPADERPTPFKRQFHEVRACVRACVRVCARIARLPARD